MTLAGFVMKGFLGGWTLVMKSIGLVRYVEKRRNGSHVFTT